MTGLYESQPFFSWQDVIRDIERQLARDAVVLHTASCVLSSVSSTYSPVHQFVVPYLPSGEIRLEKVGVMLPVARAKDDELGYWKIKPWYLDGDRERHSLGLEVSTLTRSISADKPILWSGLDLELDESGGVVIVYTAVESPPEMRSVSAFAVLRRGG